ncbi:putative tricarboxylic transport membrane protein [Rhizobium mongolense subsp. loessense]|uniref:Putative tricarboxylic transport membrane protein n=1 Tax=Rhizobium mongolense subsp. loessense TaxID=158890 RepID=A0A1G4UA29_9HYPH|nr:tripartite tricarboxylate transporter TctB family protein [Rhizobium mongolense]SCW90502.1 putative tricarboxylic transport membrane protein [Rhizobium mongolense subsp. loessense]
MTPMRGFELPAVALCVIALGVGVVFMTTQIPVPPTYAKVGPTIFPYAVGVAMICLGGLLLRDGLSRRWSCEANELDTPRPDLGPMGWVVAGLAINLILISYVGFILSSTAMFVFVAKAFGSRRLWLAALVGFLLALLAYYGFARLLDLRMGSGLIEDLF